MGYISSSQHKSLSLKFISHNSISKDLKQLYNIELKLYLTEQQSGFKEKTRKCEIVTNSTFKTRQK
jgi:hypothetical protein